MGLINTLLGRKPVATTPKGVLIPIRTTVIEIHERRVPSKFFRDRDGLWVFGRIPEIAARAKPVEEGTKFPVNISEICKAAAPNGATDEDIEKSLPVNHFFDRNGIDPESASLAILAEMMEHQWKGEEGDLAHTGRANLVYLPSCVARVRRDVDYRVWDAVTWSRVDGRWGAGSLVLSPGN